MLRQLDSKSDLEALLLRDSRLLVWLVALLTFLDGFLAVARPLAERLPDRFTDALTLVDVSAPASYLIIGFGISLMYLGYELLQRHRFAWWLAILLTLLNLFLHSILQPSILAAATAVASFVALVLARSQFRSKVHADNVWRGVVVLLASSLFALAYGTVGFWYLDKRDFGTTFSFGQAFEHTLRSFLLLGNPDLHSYTRYSRWFLHSLGLVGGLSLTYSLFSLFRPLRNRLRTLPNERARARALLEKYGGETDDFFKLWPPDKAYYFSQDGRSFVAYGVARGIALCFAGPVGAKQSIPKLLVDFQQFCLENGWTPAFAQVSDHFAAEFKSAGFKDLLIGADAVINIEQFLNQTATNKYFRNINNRFSKLGYTTARHRPPHPPNFLRELYKVSKQWMQGGRRKQWRFFTGYYSTRYLQQMPIFTAYDAQGRLMAFVNELPCFKKGEATIDLMRHRSDAPTNLMDFLFIQLLQQLQADGYKTFNLGLSPLAAGQFADSPGDKLLATLYGSNQKLISFKGLHRYKEKFEPQWQPRYLYYLGSSARLAQIGLAAAKLIKY